MERLQTIPAEVQRELAALLPQRVRLVVFSKGAAVEEVLEVLLYPPVMVGLAVLPEAAVAVELVATALWAVVMVGVVAMVFAASTLGKDLA